MKPSFALLILPLLAFTGCRNTARQSDIVKETYIHKYGVPVTKSDWDKQGQEGQTVSLRADGVTITTAYLEGIVHGPTTYTFPNSSTIQSVENYSYGTLVSKKEHFSSGMPMKEEIFENDSLVGLTLWYEDGTPKAHETYADQLLISGEFRTPLNVIDSKVHEGQGIRIWRSNDGELLSKDTFCNGQMTERVTYFANGDPATITPFTNNQMNGTRLTFRSGGIPQTVEQWVCGQQEGITVVYQNGEKFAEISYSQGKKNGIERRYRNGLLLVEEISWKDNTQHGQHKLFVDEDVKSEWYHHGQQVSQSIFERMNLPRA